MWIFGLFAYFALIKNVTMSVLISKYLSTSIVYITRSEISGYMYICKFAGQ